MPPPVRFAVKLWKGVTKHGVALVSVYLVSGAGVGPENLAILDLVGGWLRAYGRPYILTGDWQNSPQAIIDTGWPAAINGRVHSANAPTYETSVSASELFFLLFTMM